jgi:hypothetical protein
MIFVYTLQQAIKRGNLKKLAKTMTKASMVRKVVGRRDSPMGRVREG